MENNNKCHYSHIMHCMPCISFASILKSLVLLLYIVITLKNKYLCIINNWSYWSLAPGLLYNGRFYWIDIFCDISIVPIL